MQTEWKMIFSCFDVGIFNSKETDGGRQIRRYIDQVCFFYRKDGSNITFPVVLNGELKEKSLPDPCP